MKNTTSVILLALATLLICASMGLAANTNWIGPAGVETDWNTAGNWDNGLPAVATSAYVNNGGTAVISGTFSANSVGAGTNAGTSGAVVLTDNGQLTTHGITLGSGGTGGTGNFTQTGGTVIYPGASTSKAFVLSVGSGGTYAMSGGTIGVGNPNWRDGHYLYLSGDNTATIDHSGGRAYYYMSNIDGGRYLLRGSGRLQSFRLTVTGGTLSQTGGENWAAGVTVGGGSSPSSYQMSGGLLETGSISAGSQTGSGGQFGIDSPEARIKLYGLYLYDNGVFSAVPGATIRLIPDVITYGTTTLTAMRNFSTNDANCAGLANLNLVSEAGLGIVSEIEAAGKKLPDGVISDLNFTLGSLQVGSENSVGYVSLVDAFDNQPLYTGSDCLYVKNLVITSGSRLDLNGLNLYYETASIAPDAAINLSGGSLVQVPEPASMTLLLAGAAGWMIRWKRRP